MSNNSITLAILEDKKLHEQLVEKMKHQLKDLPSGSLYLKKIRGKECLYHYTDFATKHSKGKPPKAQAYLSKEDRTLKDALQQKFYIENALVHLARNLAAEDKFLSEYNPFDPIDIIENLPKACRNFNLVKTLNYNIMCDSDAEEWPQLLQIDKPLYTDGLVHCTSNGMKVRSKSEALIATLLYMNGIEYRYEIPLTLGDHTFYPDFTIMRASDRKLFYWEHFGMMSDFRYHEKAVKKLETYIKHDLMPWSRLIATFESNEDTFDSHQIDKIIKILLV